MAPGQTPGLNSSYPGIIHRQPQRAPCLKSGCISLASILTTLPQTTATKVNGSGKRTPTDETRGSGVPGSLGFPAPGRGTKFSVGKWCTVWTAPPNEPEYETLAPTAATAKPQKTQLHFCLLREEHQKG